MAETPIYLSIARVIHAMTGGRRYSTAEVAGMMDRSYSTAYRALRVIEGSHEVPMYYDPDSRTWGLLVRRRQ